jgi:hypothetical protein
MIVIGNGESRAGLDLNKIHDIKIGCNAIHRDFYVDHLVCVDAGTLREARASNLSNTVIWSRETLPPVPDGSQRADLPQHWGSGSYAVLLAAQMSNHIKILGFDLFSSNQLVNNIYKGTAHYSAADKPAVDPKYWVYQISRIITAYPDKYFTVYNKAGWQLPPSWQLANVEFKTLDNVVAML